jgi:hypothetical protein
VRSTTDAAVVVLDGSVLENLPIAIWESEAAIVI